MILNLSMESQVSTRAQRTWPSHVRQRSAPLASRWSRRLRYELMKSASSESEQVAQLLCVAFIPCYLKWFSLFPQTEYARFENGRFVYRISRSPMCEYMINFIHKLKHLPEKYMMNSVLENFTILLVITSLTWVGEIPLQDSHSSSSSLCCQGVLVAPAGFIKKKGVGGWQGLEMSSSCWSDIALIPQGMKHSVRTLLICRGLGRMGGGRNPCY